MARDWRKHIHPDLREHLEREVRSTFAHKKAYENADNKGNAQLWVAIGNLSKQLARIEKKLNMIDEMAKEAEKSFKDSDREEVSFIETPLMGQLDEITMDEVKMGDIKLPELDEVKELIERGDDLMQEISKEVKRKGKISGKKPFSFAKEKSLGKRKADGKTLGKRKTMMGKPLGKKTLKKSLKRF